MESIDHQLDLARDLCQQGRANEGKEIYLKLNVLDPNNFRVLANLGAIELNEKNFNKSITYFRKAVELNALQPIIHYNLGRALHELKLYGEAASHYLIAIKLYPNFSEAYLNYGLTLSSQENQSLALEQYKKAIEINPDYIDAYCNIGAALNISGDHEGALLAYQKAMSLNPNNDEIYYNIGVTLHQLGRYNEGLDHFNKAIQHNPDNAKAYSNRGFTFNSLGQYESALSDYQRAAQLNPNNANVFYNLGLTLSRLRQYTDALENYNKAIQVDPEYAAAYSSRGLTLNDLRQYEDAIIDHRMAIKLKSDYVEAYNNLGLTLYRLGRYDDALANYDKAIQLAPDQALAYWNKSLTKLVMGEYEEGWKLYERRWEKEGFEDRRHSNIARWTGDLDLKNKSLLIWFEQGQGDAIQFCRYALLAKHKGAKVSLEVPKRLVSLLSTIDNDISVFEEGEYQSAKFDLQIPLMSLPSAFKTTRETIPAMSPYIHLDDKKVNHWHKQLGVKSSPRVGLAWSGSTLHSNDLNRSIPLNALSAIIELPIEFHSLQVEYRKEDWDFLMKSSKVTDHQSRLKDFSDTAALIENMDLVISVDTSVAHLAGALAKPVWVMLPYSPDFRWMLNRKDSPWYPTAKLFRQHQILDWSEVINQITATLKNI